MPITITIEANDANEARQLVQDLASTIGAIRPEEFPVDTKVSTLPEPAHASPTRTSVGAPQVAQVNTASAAAAQPAQLQQPTPQAAQTSAPAASAPVAPTAQATPSPVQANAPTATPATQPALAPAAPTAPTAAPQYDFNMLGSATMQLQQAGHNIFEIFQQFGITALNQLPKERYGEYAAVLRQRGAKI